MASSSVINLKPPGEEDESGNSSDSSEFTLDDLFPSFNLPTVDKVKNEKGKGARPGIIRGVFPTMTSIKQQQQQLRPPRLRHSRNLPILNTLEGFADRVFSGSSALQNQGASAVMMESPNSSTMPMENVRVQKYGKENIAVGVQPNLISSVRSEQYYNGVSAQTGNHEKRTNPKSRVQATLQILLHLTPSNLGERTGQLWELFQEVDKPQELEKLIRIIISKVTLLHTPPSTISSLIVPICTKSHNFRKLFLDTLQSEFESVFTEEGKSEEVLVLEFELKHAVLFDSGRKTLEKDLERKRSEIKGKGRDLVGLIAHLFLKDTIGAYILVDCLEVLDRKEEWLEYVLQLLEDTGKKMAEEEKRLKHNYNRNEDFKVYRGFFQTLSTYARSAYCSPELKKGIQALVKRQESGWVEDLPKVEPVVSKVVCPVYRTTATAAWKSSGRAKVDGNLTQEVSEEEEMTTSMRKLTGILNKVYQRNVRPLAAEFVQLYTGKSVEVKEAMVHRICSEIRKLGASFRYNISISYICLLSLAAHHSPQFLQEVKSSLKKESHQVLEQLKKFNGRDQGLAAVLFFSLAFKECLLGVEEVVKFVDFLLDCGNEDSYDCICRLLKDIGGEFQSRLRTQNPPLPTFRKQYLDQVFTSLSSVINPNCSLSPRVGFAIKNLIEQRENGWKARDLSGKAQLVVLEENKKTYNGNSRKAERRLQRKVEVAGWIEGAEDKDNVLEQLVPFIASSEPTDFFNLEKVQNGECAAALVPNPPKTTSSRITYDRERLLLLKAITGKYIDPKIMAQIPEECKEGYVSTNLRQKKVGGAKPAQAAAKRKN